MSDIQINKNYSNNEIPVSSNIPLKEDDKTEDLLFDDEKYQVNGVLDKNFSQGSMGNCGSVSTLVSFKNSPTGSEIIKNSILKTDNGYSVYFKKLDKPYEITFDELQVAFGGDYVEKLEDDSKIDSDALLLMIGYEKACEENPSGIMKLKKKFYSIFDPDRYSDKKSIEAENPYHLMELITGKNAKSAVNFLGKFSSYNRILDKFKNKDFVACVSFYANEGETKYIDLYPSGKVVATESGGHVWSLKSFDDKTVTLINPWDITQDVVIKRDELSKADRIEYCIFN